MTGAATEPISFAHKAEYAALRAVVRTLAALDWQTASNIGARIGALGYRPLGIRRRVVERQIAAAFPGLDEVDVRRLALAAYEHLGRSSIEAAILPRLGRNAVLDLFEGADRYDVVEEARSKGRGLIFVTGHLGNWELAGAYVAARGIPVDAIARRMKNPLFDPAKPDNDTNKRYFILRKTLAVPYKLPGGQSTRELAGPERGIGEEKWIMR